jgi:hypothetical protein
VVSDTDLRKQNDLQKNDTSFFSFLEVLGFLFEKLHASPSFRFRSPGSGFLDPEPWIQTMNMDPK